MKVEIMRKEVSNAYISDIWHKKVKKMPDNQIIAIYYNLKKAGTFDKPKKKAKKPEYLQLSLDINLDN